MIITKQCGGVVAANSVELLGCKIRCIPDDDHRVPESGRRPLLLQ